MAELTQYKLIAAVLIFAVSLITILYPLKKKKPIHATERAEIGEALASGIFLGAAFFHMLPDAVHAFAHHYPNQPFPIAEGICVGGFLFLLFLERISFVKAEQNHSPDAAHGHTHAIPYIIAFTLIIHSLIEGMALGIGNTFSQAFMIFIAILAHKGSESYALCTLLMQHQLAFRRLLGILLFFALMTPLGILLGTLMNALPFTTDNDLPAAIFNAFAAGSFLYISTLHHVHFHHHARGVQSMIEFFSLTLGTVLMGIIAIWV